MSIWEIVVNDPGGGRFRNPELFHHWQERDGLTKGQTATFQPGHGFPRCRQGLPELEHKARFAQAYFPSDRDHLPMARLDLLEEIQ